MPGPGSLRAFFTLSPSDLRPTSPAFSEATDASGPDLGEDAPEKIITRAQLQGQASVANYDKASVANYDKLMSSCAAYRAALMTLSEATAAFTNAMGACAVAALSVSSYQARRRLQDASGLHHLMGTLAIASHRTTPRRSR